MGWEICEDLKINLVMKKLFFFIFFFLFFNFLNAQEFANPDSEWVYEYDGFWNIGVTKINYKRDTLVGARPLREFQRTFLRKARNIPDTLEVIYDNALYFHAKDGIVEYSEDLIHFDTLFNFCLLYTSPSPRDATLSRMPSSA